MEEKNKSLSQDFFLYLFSTIALWIVATNFGTIIFQIINIYIPDVAMPEPPPYSRNLIRWSIASLIVVFPIYVLVMRFLNRDVRTFAEKAELKIRKWLLNLTLFLAAIVIISDLISLIYNFLQGELTLRFSLKIITIFVISAGIFSYYRKILKSESGILILLKLALRQSEIESRFDSLGSIGIPGHELPELFHGKVVELVIVKTYGKLKIGVFLRFLCKSRKNEKHQKRYKKHPLH